MLPPGPRVLPLVNALRYARDPLRFFPRLRERYGDVFTVSFPDFRRVVYLAEPSLVRELFTGDPASCTPARPTRHCSSRPSDRARC